MPPLKWSRLVNGGWGTEYRGIRITTFKRDNGVVTGKAYLPTGETYESGVSRAEVTWWLIDTINGR